MFDLPGSNPEMDKQVIDEVINNPDYRADQWKLYPTETTAFTKIKEWYDKGLYKPYAEDNKYGLSWKLVDVIKYAMTNVPCYIRINRVVRDIPTKSILGGLKYTNLRQIIKHKMDKEGLKCKDIREREIKLGNKNLNNNIMNDFSY